MGEHFQTTYLQTLGSDFSYKTEQVGEEKVEYSIWDIAGQDHFQMIHPHYFHGSSIGIFVHDISRKETFESIENWIGRFLTYCGYKNPLIVIVGNKTDLDDQAFLPLDKQKR